MSPAEATPALWARRIVVGDSYVAGHRHTLGAVLIGEPGSRQRGGAG